MARNSLLQWVALAPIMPRSIWNAAQLPRMRRGKIIAPIRWAVFSARGSTYNLAFDALFSNLCLTLAFSSSALLTSTRDHRWASASMKRRYLSSSAPKAYKGAPRRVRFWLALRGSPPGRRLLPVIAQDPENEAVRRRFTTLAGI